VQSGCSAVISEDLKYRVDADVCENKQFATEELHEVFPFIS
jgi:hypothetical protein